MARPIERIEQDIAELEKAIGAIAEQLQNSYESYLEVLGEAVSRQLILASYHLCTQGYPRNFLKLSLNQRQKFQQGMRKLGKVAAEEMKALMNDNEELPQTNPEVEEIDREFSEEEIEEKLELEEDDLEEILQQLKPEDEGLEGIVQKLQSEDEGLEVIVQKLQSEDEGLEGIVQKLQSEDEDSVVNNFSPETSSVSLPEDTKVSPLPSPSSLFPQTPPFSKDWKKSFNPNTSNPMELAAWQKNLERAIAYILKNLSRDGNRLLKKVNILPKKLPEPILEAAAASSESSTEAMPGPPNILNLVIGIEGEQQQPENFTQVMTLNLRLVEIEFADIKLSSERKQIRNILNQLGKHGREYQKKQRELSIATAEAAWRASWYED